MKRLLAWGIGLAVGSSAAAGDWPQFRGPGGAGTTAETNLPTTWSADKNVAWKTKLSGRGWSSPIVWKGKIYLTIASSELDARAPMGGGPGGGRGGAGGPPGGGGQGGPPGGGGQGGGRGGGGFGGGKPPDVPFKFEVACFDLATGNEVWRKLALEAKPRIAIQQSNTYATETPVTDGERIYAYFGMTGLFCYDLAGNFLWKKDLGAFPIMFGPSSSPVAADGKLFVLVDNDQKSFLVALDGKTGEQVWKVDRAEKTNYSTPLVWKNKTRTELVVAGSPMIRSYDPATGKPLWELAVGGGQATASPVGTDDLLYVGVGSGPGGGGRGPGGPGGGPPGGGGQPPPGGGRGGPGGGPGTPGLYAVKAGATGDITPKTGETTSAGVAWSAPRAGVSRSTPLLYQGHVYLLEQNGGLITCFDAATGKAAYTKERIPNARGFWASPWGYDGKVFCLDDAGTTHVLQAGPEFKPVGTNKLTDTTWATPALAGGSVIIRGTGYLYGIKQ